MKNKTTQGLGNKNLLSFPKHDSLKYWRLVKVTPVKSLPLTHAKQPNMRVPTTNAMYEAEYTYKWNFHYGSVEHVSVYQWEHAHLI